MIIIAGVRVCPHSCMRARPRAHACMQACRHVGMQACGHAGMQACSRAGRQTGGRAGAKVAYACMHACCLGKPVVVWAFNTH